LVGERCGNDFRVQSAGSAFPDLRECIRVLLREPEIVGRIAIAVDADGEYIKRAPGSRLGPRHAHLLPRRKVRTVIRERGHCELLFRGRQRHLAVETLIVGMTHGDGLTASVKHNGLAPCVESYWFAALVQSDRFAAGVQSDRL